MGETNSSREESNNIIISSVPIILIRNWIRTKGVVLIGFDGCPCTFYCFGNLILDVQCPAYDSCFISEKNTEHAMTAIWDRKKIAMFIVNQSETLRMWQKWKMFLWKWYFESQSRKLSKEFKYNHNHEVLCGRHQVLPVSLQLSVLRKYKYKENTSVN